MIFRRLLLLAGILALAGCATAPEPAGPVRQESDTAARDRIVRLQIFLDSQNFGPGVVDGRDGEFTAKALARYREAHGLPAGALPDTNHIEPYTTYVIRPEDMERLGEMASEPAEIAKQKRLPYTDAAELVAERFHTSRAFLAELNRNKPLSALRAGDAVIVPNVFKPFRLEDFPSAYPPASEKDATRRHVIVDVSQRMLEVRDGGHLIAAFPITPGSSEHPAPAGEWKILRAVPWPWFRYDEGVLKRGERTEDYYLFPPGPNSPVGILWAGLNRPGTGIHGTSSPETIGRSGSHGCIRLANWDAATFYTLVGKGTPVTIR